MRAVFICFLFLCMCQISMAQRQGVQGQLYWVTGNELPGPDRKHIPQQGVAREIFVYELATPSDVLLENGFFKKVYTRLVARGLSKTNGSFKIRLDPGYYSVFVKERDGLYANVFDSDNHISPVKVEPKKYSWITISIDYQAAY